MNFITDFADQAVVLPLVVAVGVGLLVQGWRRGAAAWAVAVLATFSVMLALKLAFLACPASEIRTPSGHVAAASVVAGGLAALLLRRSRMALLLAAGVAALIGMTRLALGAHTPVEVLVGAAVGLAGAWALVSLAGRPPAGIDARRIAVLAGAVVLIFHGMHLPAEAHIRNTAWRFAQSLVVCQSDELRR
jgi:membrane-associated phospholipid phosphatase